MWKARTFPSKLLTLKGKRHEVPKYPAKSFWNILSNLIFYPIIIIMIIFDNNNLFFVFRLNGLNFTGSSCKLHGDLGYNPSFSPFVDQGDIFEVLEKIYCFSSQKYMGVLCWRRAVIRYVRSWYGRWRVSDTLQRLQGQHITTTIKICCIFTHLGKK